LSGECLILGKATASSALFLENASILLSRRLEGTRLPEIPQTRQTVYTLHGGIDRFDADCKFPDEVLSFVALQTIRAAWTASANMASKSTSPQLTSRIYESFV